MISRLRLVAAATLTLAVLPLGATASAETWTRADARGDVEHLTADFDDPEITPAPEDAHTDITRVTVRHRTGRLVVDTRFRDLRGGPFFLNVEMRTSWGEAGLLVMRQPGARLFQVAAETADGGGITRCSGKRVEIDRDRDRIRLDVPRSCLGAPTWVRARVDMMTGDLTSGEDVGIDELPDSERRGVRFSPKVRVG